MTADVEQCSESHPPQERTARPSGSDPKVDFHRDVYCIAGLPVDAVSMAEAVRRVRRAAFDGERCVIATPNLNFVVAARSDAAFRDSVCRSDLVLADGMPLIWMARLLRLPIRERVSGAGLFEALCAHAGPPVTVYFFGGPPGVAAAACEALRTRGDGLRCVGYESPPYDSIAALNDGDTIDRINASGAQFVIVALGAKKGQAWIEHNRTRLAAPVLCHLGAVVNFAAGAIRRAPAIWQKLGFEWLWRIKEEPALWRRYLDDGAKFTSLLSFCLIPYAVRLRLRSVDGAGGVQVDHGPDGTTIRAHGTCYQPSLEILRKALQEAAGDGRPLKVDLEDLEYADSAFVALLLIAEASRRARFNLVRASPSAVRLLRYHSAGFLLSQDATHLETNQAIR